MFDFIKRVKWSRIKLFRLRTSEAYEMALVGGVLANISLIAFKHCAMECRYSDVISIFNTPQFISIYVCASLLQYAVNIKVNNHISLHETPAIVVITCSRQTLEFYATNHFSIFILQFTFFHLTSDKFTLKVKWIIKTYLVVQIHFHFSSDNLSRWKESVNDSEVKGSFWKRETITVNSSSNVILDTFAMRTYFIRQTTKICF